MVLYTVRFDFILFLSLCDISLVKDYDWGFNPRIECMFFIIYCTYQILKTAYPS